MLRAWLRDRCPRLKALVRSLRNRLYLLRLRLDRNRYAKPDQPIRNRYLQHAARSTLINQQSGEDIQYQYNKVHNLKLAADCLEHMTIRPGETFSLLLAIRNADRAVPFKDGLTIEYGKLTADYGGGLCQLSQILFTLFLHTPLTIVERHGHSVKAFPSPDEGVTEGLDAIICRGRLDVKVRNDTAETFQLMLSFDDTYMNGWIFTDTEPRCVYSLFNRERKLVRAGDALVHSAEVWRRRTDFHTRENTDEKLYTHRCRLGYEPETEEECRHVS